MTMPRTYFTADTHFGHARSIELCERPFADVAEMNESMIANWNVVVGPDDTVYHLGDFAYRARPDEAAAIFGRLNGIKHLVAGNHDNAITRILGWASVSEMLDVTVDHQRLFLCHYPILEWPRFHRGSWHLFGHVHGNEPGVGRSLDVGVDVWGYRPVSLSDIRQRLRDSRRIDVHDSFDRRVLADVLARIPDTVSHLPTDQVVDDLSAMMDAWRVAR